MKKKELEAQLDSIKRALNLLFPDGSLRYDAVDGGFTYYLPDNSDKETIVPVQDSPDTPVHKRAQLLRDAEEIINGARAQTYGPPEISFNRIADIWNAMGLRMMAPTKPNPETDPHVPGHEIIYKANKVDATDVALILIGMKLSRTVGAKDHEDNWLDLAGYAGLGAELADGEK